MASTTQITLDDKIFQKLLDTLDKIDDRLTKIGASTDKLQKRSAKVEFKFGGIDIFTKFVDAVTPQKVNLIVKLIDSLDKLSGVDFGKIKFDSLTSGLEKLSKLGVSQDVEEITKAVSRFGSGLTKLFGGNKIKGDELNGVTSLIEKLNFKNSFNLGKNILILQGILGVVGLLSSKLPGANTIRELSLTLERLGIGISGLFRNIDKINVSNSKKLAALLTGLVLGFNILSRFAGDVNKLKALGSAFTGVASLLDAVFKGIDIKNVGKSKSITKVLQERVGFIVDVVKSFRKLKANNLAGLGDAFQGIAKAFSAISDIEASGGGITKGTIDNLRNFIRAFQELNNVRVSKNTAQAISGLGAIFSSANLSKIESNATEFGGNLSNAVALGFIKGSLILKVAGVLGRLFTDLNPALLLGKFSARLIGVFVGLDRQVTTILNNLVSKIQNFGSTLTNIGTNLVSNFGLGALTSSPGFGIAVEFDNLAKRAEVFGNLSEEQLQKVLDLADAIGIKYPLSANEALAAINNLQKAGLGVEDLQNAVAPIADLAALSESGSIENASQEVIQIVNSFKLLKDGVVSTFENTNVVADILSATADKSTASVESLGQGLANVGPIASAFGLNFQQTAAILGIFEDNGIRGAEAGTQLKSVLSNLTRPTEAVQKELNRLGISLTDQQGNFRNINDIINDFNSAFNDTKTITVAVSNVSDDQKDRLTQAQKAFAKATQQILLYNDGLTAGSLDEKNAQKKIAQFQEIQNNASAVIAEITGSQTETERVTRELTRTQSENFRSIQTIFGTFGQQGAAILINSGTDAINDFIASTEDLPTAAERAQQLLDTFKGSTEQLRGSFETLLKNAFLPLIDTIFKPLVDGMLAFVNSLLLLNPEFLATVSTAVAFGAALATIVGTILIVAGAFISFGAAIASIVVPFLTFTGAITTVVSLLGGFLAFVAGFAAFALIATPLAAILLILAAGFRSLIGIFKNNIGGAADGLKSFGDSIGLLFSNISELGAAIGLLFNAVFGGDDQSLENTGSAIKSVFESLAKPIQVFSQFINDAASAIRAFVRFFKGATFNDTALERLAENPFISGILDRTGLGKSAEGLRKLFTSIKTGLNLVKGSFQQIGLGVAGFISLLQSGSTFEQAFDFAARSFQAGAGHLGAVALQTIQSLFGIDFQTEIESLNAGKIGEAIASLLSRAIDSVKDLILANREGIKGVLTSIFDFFFVPGKIFKTLFNFLGLNEIGSVFESFEKTLTDLFGGIVDTIFNLIAGDDIATAIRKAFGPGIEPVITFIQTLGEVVQNAIGLVTDLISALSPTGGQQVQFNLLDVVTSVLEALSAGLLFLNDSVLVPLRNLVRTIDFQAIFDFVSDLFSSFANFFRLLFTGDFTGALDQLSGIGKTIGNALQSIITSLFDVQFTPDASVIQSVAEAIVGILRFSLNAVANLLGFENFQVLAETVIQKVGDAISNFLGSNPARKFDTIATDILTGLGQSVTDAFVDIGDFLNIDTTNAESILKTAFQDAIDNIKIFFLGEDGDTSIFDSIATIFQKLGDAVSNLINLFTGGEASTGQEKILTFQDVVGGLLDFFANLVDLGLETISEPLAGVGKFFADLSKLDSNKLLIIVGVIGAFTAALLPMIAPGFASGIGSVVSSIGRFAGMFAVVEIVKNFAANADLLVKAISLLLDLNVADAIGTLTEFVGLTASGITFDVLGLFGIDNIFGMTEEQINENVTKIAGGVSTLLQSIGQSVVDFFTNTVIPIVTGVRDFISPIINKLGVALRVIGTIVFSPIILFLKAIQAFVELPQEQRDRVVNFFVLLGAAFAIYKTLQLVQAAGGIAGLFTAIRSGGGIINILSTIAPALTGFASSLVGFATTVVFPLLGILSLFLLLSSAISNAEKFFSAIFNLIALLDAIIHLDVKGIFTSLGGFFGDLIDFVLSTFKDVVFTILDFLGIDNIFGQTKEDIETTINQIVTIIKLAFQQAGNFISNFFTGVFDDLALKIKIAGADIRLAISDAAARARTIGQDASNDPFFKAASIFADPSKIDLGAFSRAIGDATFSQEDLDLFATKNAGNIVTALTTALGDPGLVPDVTEFQNIISKLDLAGAVDNATREALENADPVIRQSFLDLFATALTLPSDQQIITPAQIKTILDTIIAEVKAGTVDADKALSILDLVPVGGEGQLTQEQKDALIKQISDLKAQAQSLVTGTQTGGGVTFGPQVSTEPTPTGSDIFKFSPILSVEPIIEADPEKLKADINAKVDEIVGATPTTDGTTPIQPVIEVSPTFEALTSTDDVQTLALDFTILNGNIETAKGTFDDFATKVTDNVTNLQSLSDKVIEVSGTFTVEAVTIQTSWQTLSIFLTDSLNTINGGLTKISSGIKSVLNTLLVTNPLIAAQLLIFKTSWSQTILSVLINLQQLINKVNDLNFILGIVIARLGQIQGTDPSQFGSANPDGLAEGGSVRPGLFEVIENGIPEMLFQNGKAFLLSPGFGRVEPVLPQVGMQTFGGIPALPSASNATSFGGNSQNVVVNEGDINIQIDGAGQSADTLVPRVRDVVRQELNNRNSNFKGQLRTAGRS